MACFSTAVCGGERCGASALGTDTPASAARLGGAPGADEERDRRHPIPEHAPISAATYSGRSGSRDPSGR